MRDLNPKKVLALAISVVAGLTLLCTVFGSFTVVEPGNVGVVFNQVTGSLSTHGQGLVGKVPFVTSVQSYPASLRTYTMVQRSNEGSANNDDSIDLPSKEGQHIKQDISVTYNTSEDKAAQVFKAFRGEDIRDIESTFIRRTIITAAQNVAGSMALSDLISTGRDKLQNEIENSLKAELGKMGFNVDHVNLGASHLPAAIEAQMQQKMAAQQEAQQAEYELQKQTTLAKAAVAKAEGEANAQVVLADGQARANKKILETLTVQLIEFEKVKKWNGILPTVTGSQSLINLTPSNK
jgi:regulator of protease activity HflC (stomatin/prohibitin superfamily)